MDDLLSFADAMKTELKDKIPSMEDDSHSGGNCSYDADASNDSIELNLSLHEDSDHNSHNHPNSYQPSHQQHQQQLAQPSSSHHPTLTTIEVTTPDQHHRSYGEAAARGTAPFIPISEETVFLDTDPVTSSGISTMSSPMSCDSWMNYSSNSSDDLSCISERIHVPQDSSEDSSTEFDANVVTAQSTPKTKRNFNNFLLTGDRVETHAPLFPPLIKQKGNHAGSSGSSSASGQTKRLRGKSSKTASSTSTPSIAAGSIKRKASLHRNSSLSGAICDIRMIDFAHTTFVRKNHDTHLAPNAGAVQHQGPDNGFLRGIESLKRLLNEIMSDDDEQ